MAEPAIIYLDADDEITAAASRIRSAEPSHVVLVIPPGSHIATSRINFRLLAREAQERNRRLSIVAPDSASRSIAQSAGLDVHPSVAAFESAMAAGGAAFVAQAAEATSAAAASVTAPAGAPAAAVGAPTTPDDVPIAPVAAAGIAAGATAATGAAASAPPVAPLTVAPEPVAPVPAPKPTTRASAIAPKARRRGSRLLLISTLIVVGLVLAGAVGAAVYLPSATITIAPRPEAVGPVELTVSADPAATTVDRANGVVPATTVSFPVSVEKSFPSTGKKVTETNATGTVTFDSVNTVGPVAVASGTRVSTLGGIVFATTKAVTVPKATVAGTTIKHGQVSVAIRATKPGPDGNVDAGEITQVPDFLSTQQVSANNAKATTGGTHTESARVTAKDVDDAKAALQVEATRAFAASVSAGEGVPQGQTLFPGTATLGPLSYKPDPKSLVNDEVATFTLAATAEGTATAVDVNQVESIAQSRLEERVAAGAALVPDSVDIVTGDATATGSIVTFPVTAKASQIRSLDAESLKAEILGLPVDDAKVILERSGLTSIDTWPDWVTSIPTNGSRVTVTVSGGVTASPAAPSQPP